MASRNRNIVLVAAGLAIVAVGLWLVFQTDRGAAPGDPNDPDQVASGLVLYQKNCASCHGENLEGQVNWRERLPSGKLPAPPHDETGHTWHHPDLLLFEITKKGSLALAPQDYKTDMMGFGDQLSDQEIWSVLSYIKSRWPEKIRRRQADTSDKSRR